MNSAVMKETSEKQIVKFGDICREVKLTTKDPLADGYDRYIGLEHLDSGSLKIKRWGSVAEDNPSFTRVFKKGQILFGKRRPYLKKAAIAEFDGICSGDIVVIEPKDDWGLPELVPIIFQSNEFWSWAVKTSSGSLSPRTKFSSLSGFEFGYDGSTIEGSIKVLSALSRLEQNSVDVQSSVLSLANSYLDMKLWHFYANDDYIKLKNVCLKITDGTHQKVERDKNGEIPFLYVSCIGRGVVHWENTDRVTNTIYSEISKGREIDENVVLYAAVGSYGNAVHIGESAVAAFQRHIAYIKINPEKANPKFIEIWFNSRYGRFHSDRLAIGNAQKTVTLGDLSRFPIPKMSRDEQDEVVNVYTSMSSLLNSINDAEQRSLILKESVICNI